MLSRVVSIMMRRTKGGKRGQQFFKKGRPSSENKKNNGRCCECEKFGHVQAECPNLKNKINKDFRKKKAFRAWSDEEESNGEEMANMCFMELGETDEDESDNEGNAI